MIQDYKKYIKSIGELDRDSDVLLASISADLNQVFYADDLSSELTARDLSVRYVAQEQFYKMITGDPSVNAQFDPKILYIVSADDINAYDTNVKNVANPVEAKDAANKRYVDEQLELSATSKFNYLSSYVDNDLNVENALTGKSSILTSLSQSAGKISYAAKTLEISDVKDLQSSLTSSNAAFTALSNDMWNALSDIAKYNVSGEVSFNDIENAVFKLAKALQAKSSK